MPHLINTRSHFSMGRSILSPKNLVAKASELGYESVVMTDDATISGMTQLFDCARSLETPLKVVAGVTVQVFDDPTYRPPSKRSGETPKKNQMWEAKLLIRNEAGLKAVFRLLSTANSDDYFYYTPRIGLKELIIALRSDGLTLLTGDFFPLFTHAKAEQISDILAKHVAAHNIAVELIPLRTAYFDRVNREALRIAQKHEFRIVPSRPVLYQEGDDEARDIMSYIMGRSNANHRLRNIPYYRDLFAKPPTDLQVDITEMFERLGVDPLPDATSEIIGACEYEWHKLDMCLPKMAEDEFAELVKLSKEGWAKRISKEVFGYKPPESKISEYKQRLAYELKVLRDMGFDRYFLLVRDVIMWSKENGILVGPARGSAAGSLVAYLIGITDVDPIRFDLIFERFLNPDRLDYPDIDTDFMSSRRHDVIEYITGKFGDDRVAGISNYTSLGSASAIRDVGRIYELSQDELSCTKVIEQNMSLEDAKDLPEIQRYAEAHPKQMEVSTALDGAMRSLGRHAAGVVVAGEPLIERCVVERRKGEAATNWDKRTVEDWGLIKLDILGLSTLDIMALIEEKLAKDGRKIDWTSIPLDDEKTLEAFALGKTVGIFQFTSGGMRQLLKDISSGGRGVTFEDVYAATALFRPGPLQSGMTEGYVRVKQGIERPDYPHPKTEAALLETKGIIVYQEQVMQIARDLCGYTMGESDKLRKAMGKKDPEEMAKHKDKFVQGAVDTSGMGEEEAAELFDHIEKFAGYGFNKSHSVAYTIISYLCMYAKVHYPGEFYAASLSVVGEDSLRPIVKDAAANNLFIVPPDINKSSMTFEAGYDVARDQHILYAPLDRVKQVSAKGAQAILEAREKVGGKFLSYKQFEDTVQKRACNAKARANLDAVGAFAGIEPDQIDPRHPDRLKDQKELLPNLMLANVKASKDMIIDPFVKGELAKLFDRIRAKEVDEDGDPTGIQPVIPVFGAKPKFMIVTDSATYFEEQAGKMAEGKGFHYMQSALKEAGLRKSMGYYTALVKAKKKDKMLANSEISTWCSFLDEELELLKPQIIVAAGGAASRYLCPDIKGGWEELAGQVIYDVKRDCSIVLAPNPQMIFAKPDVQTTLDSIMMEVAEMIS